MSMKELKITLEVMPTSEFMAMEDYFANRNVNRRMGKTHMKGELVSNAQRLVSAYELDGKRFKIDGHSRTEAWSRGQLEMPETVACVIYHCQTLLDVHQLYKAMVSKLTAETKAEAGYSARKRIGFDPASPFCQSSWGAAFTLLGFSNDEDGLTEFLTQFKIVDSWNIQSVRSRELSVGVKAAMLESLKDHETIARQFWIKYRQEDVNEPSILILLTHMAQPGVGQVWSNGVYRCAMSCYQAYKTAVMANILK